MLTVLGSKIHMHQGDDAAFRILYKDEHELRHEFHPEDILTMTIFQRDSSKVILSRVAEFIKLSASSTAIMRFQSSDATVLTPDSYLYNLEIETREGIKSTLISRGVLNVLKNPTFRADTLGFQTARLVSLDTDEIYICPIALICKFPRQQIHRVEAEGTLILFDRLHKEPEPEDTTEDTLILFGASQDDPPQEEETLILF